MTRRTGAPHGHPADPGRPGSGSPVTDMARAMEIGKRRQYERTADIYELERYHQLPHMPFYLRFRSEMIVEAIRHRIPGGDRLRILDVGCGTGVTLPELRRGLPGATVVGIDLAARALHHARDKTRDPVTRVHLCQASGFELPCADGSVDVLISTRFIHQFPGPLKRAVYAEFRRVVRAGGIIIVEFYARAYARLHSLIPRRLAWWRGPDAPQNAPPEEYFSHYPTRAEVREIVGADFECVPVRPVLCRWLHRALGERGTRALTRALRHDPSAALYSEYLAISRN